MTKGADLKKKKKTLTLIQIKCKLQFIPVLHQRHLRWFSPVHEGYLRKKESEFLRPSFSSLHQHIFCPTSNQPGFCVKNAEYVLAGHEAFLHVADLQVVQGEHVLLLLLL